MTKLEQYREVKICDLPEIDFKVWVMDEITSLINDCGQSINDDILEHTARRLYEKLKTVYRSWSVGDVHSVFQVGLSGGYGSFRRITVQALFIWLKVAQNQRGNIQVAETISNNNSEKYSCVADNPKYGSPIIDFLIWATKNFIYLGIEWPEHQKHTPPKPLLDLSEKYHKVKKNPKQLYNFKQTLQNAEA